MRVPLVGKLRTPYTLMGLPLFPFSADLHASPLLFDLFLQVCFIVRQREQEGVGSVAVLNLEFPKEPGLENS